MSAKTVLLINPPLHENQEYGQTGNLYPPLGILYIGTWLKKNGFLVKIIDTRVVEDYYSAVEYILANEELCFAGLSVMTSQIPGALKLSSFIKDKKPGVKVVWGGIHPTLFPEQTCQDPRIDITVLNEGAETSLELARCLETNGDLSAVQGIAYKDAHNRITKTPARALADIQNDSFDFSLVEVNKYINLNASNVGGETLATGSQRRSMPVLTALGCPYHCTFCINAILNKKYRFKKAERIVAEIEYLMKTYQANDFGLIDEDFFINKKRLIDFLDLLEQKKLKISWHTSLRADHFQDDYLNEQLMLRVKRSGGFHFGIGAESGSERVLQKLVKGIKKEQVLKAAQLSRKCEFNIGFSFMTGLPDETDADRKATVKFCAELFRENRDNYIIGPQVYRPYPGSPLYDEAMALGLKVPSSLEEWGKVYNDIEGYYELEKLPWIKNPERIRRDLFYLHYAFERGRPRQWIKRLVGPLLRSLALLRVRYGFMGWPVEYRLFRTILKRDL